LDCTPITISSFATPQKTVPSFNRPVVSNKMALLAGYRRAVFLLSSRFDILF
jgi:hypothetical protein